MVHFFAVSDSVESLCSGLPCVSEEELEGSLLMRSASPNSQLDATRFRFSRFRAISCSKVCRGKSRCSNIDPRCRALAL